jgi:hypothetical protein
MARGIQRAKCKHRSLAVMVPFLLVKGDTVHFVYHQVNLPLVIYRAASTIDQVS